MEDLKIIVAQRLKQLIESRNISQSEFAKLTGISKDTVSKLVNGKYSLSIPNAIRISDEFQVSLEYLYGRETEENRMQYALDILLKHFPVCKDKSFWDISRPEVHIMCSPALAELLNKLSTYQDAQLPDDILLELEQREKKTFLSVIEDTPKDTDTKKYLLLDANYCTPEVMEVIEKAKKEIVCPP